MRGRERLRAVRWVQADSWDVILIRSISSHHRWETGLLSDLLSLIEKLGADIAVWRLLLVLVLFPLAWLVVLLYFLCISIKVGLRAELGLLESDLTSKGDVWAACLLVLSLQVAASQVRVSSCVRLVGRTVLLIKIDDVSVCLHVNVGNVLVQHHPSLIGVRGRLVIWFSTCRASLLVSSCLQLVDEVKRPGSQLNILGHVDSDLGPTCLIALSLPRKHRSTIGRLETLVAAPWLLDQCLLPDQHAFECLVANRVELISRVELFLLLVPFKSRVWLDRRRHDPWLLWHRQNLWLDIATRIKRLVIWDFAAPHVFYIFFQVIQALLFWYLCLLEGLENIFIRNHLILVCGIFMYFERYI